MPQDNAESLAAIRAQFRVLDAGLEEVSRLFDELHRSRLDGGIMTADTAAELVRTQADRVRTYAAGLTAAAEEKTPEADAITRRIAPSQALLTAEPAEVAVPRTELSYWQAIAAALNAAVAAGMPIGIDLDGTLTDHNSWSVVYDRDSQQWTVDGYDEGFTATAPSEEKDTRTGSQPVWDGFTAREEIIGVLISAGYNEAAAKELLGRADHEPHALATGDEFASTLAGGHALIFEDIGTDERLATCQCGRRLGSVGTPGSITLTGIWFLAWKSHLHTEVGN